MDLPLGEGLERIWKKLGEGEGDGSTLTKGAAKRNGGQDPKKKGVGKIR